jgi:F-type H+-transporting ATPase subunit epsilon
MSDKVNLKIITPSGIMYDGQCDMVIMRTKSGDVGILASHQPMVTILDYGVLKVVDEGAEVNRAAVLGGYAEVSENCVSILTDAAEWADEIDMLRANHAKEVAEQRLASHDENIDVMRAELALKRAMVRINIKSL